MKKIPIFVLLLALAAAGCRSAIAPVDPNGIYDFKDEDAQVRSLMARERVNGLALALVDGGILVHVAAFGKRSVEKDLPLTPDTILYGASLTKTAVAYLVLQLVDEGKLDLDASVATLLPKPLPEYEEFGDLAGDERWRALTPRILLSHRTGFANFRWLEEDGKLRFHSDPGSRYGYSGEGFYILQLALEEGLHLDLGAEMQKRIFGPLGMTRTSMSWRPDFAENLADGYGIDGKMEPHDERSRASAAGSMDTTITDQGKMWEAIARGIGLSAAARAELVKPQWPIASAHQFPTLAPQEDPRNAAIGLAAGLGVITFESSKGRAFFKGGHNDWTGNMAVCIDRGAHCVVLLANDVRAEKIYPEIVELYLGDIGVPWYWEYNLPPAPDIQ